MSFSLSPPGWVFSGALQSPGPLLMKDTTCTLSSELRKRKCVAEGLKPHLHASSWHQEPWLYSPLSEPRKHWAGVQNGEEGITILEHNRSPNRVGQSLGQAEGQGHPQWYKQTLEKSSDYCLMSYGCSARSAQWLPVWVARLQDSQENCRKETDRAVVQPSFATEEMQSGSQGRDNVHGRLQFSDRGSHVPTHPVSTCP